MPPSATSKSSSPTPARPPARKSDKLQATSDKRQAKEATNLSPVTCRLSRFGVKGGACADGREGSKAARGTWRSCGGPPRSHHLSPAQRAALRYGEPPSAKRQVVGRADAGPGAGPVALRSRGGEGLPRRLAAGSPIWSGH